MNLPTFTGDEPCAEVGVDWFVPDDTSNRIMRVKKLRQICAPCPMREPCLEYALHVNVEGFWGGMTDGERRKERRARGIRAHRILAIA
jgi:WhiB family redox-sensing transcriptional regulator